MSKTLLKRNFRRLESCSAILPIRAAAFAARYVYVVG